MSLGLAALSAIRNHPELDIAEAQIQAAEARARQATAPWYPTVNGRTGFNYSEAQSLAAGGQNLIRVGLTRNYSVGVTARQTITDFGRTRNQVIAAEQNSLAVKEDKNGVYQDLMLTVAESYFQVLREQANVEINEEVVRNSQVQLDRAQGFFDAGTRARIEVTRAQADLASAKVGLIQALNAEQRARVTLATSMGLNQSLDEPLIQARLSEPSWTIDDALKISLDHRPDKAALQARGLAARASVQAARQQYWPTLGASYSYSWSAPTFLPQPYNWGFGLDLQFPIFNEPTLSSQVDQAKASEAENQARQQLLILQIRREVTDAWLNLKASKEQAEAARIGRISAEENYRLASERYAVGVGSSIEVSDAQRQLVQARGQELQAAFETQVALARFYRATGTMALDVLLGVASELPAPPDPTASPGPDPTPQPGP